MRVCVCVCVCVFVCVCVYSFADHIIKFCFNKFNQ